MCPGSKSLVVRAPDRVRCPRGGLCSLCVLCDLLGLVLMLHCYYDRAHLEMLGGYGLLFVLFFVWWLPSMVCSSFEEISGGFECPHCIDCSMFINLDSCWGFDVGPCAYVVFLCSLAVYRVSSDERFALERHLVRVWTCPGRVLQHVYGMMYSMLVVAGSQCEVGVAGVICSVSAEFQWELIP
ncbi:hypothetical protein Nepgr_020316 [Nepenthes gracilis]|uniref:Uncharacterized protein n=1 Tax=Nepenthes gracilis TaxID=150966 RepID=A0AAD3SWM0_NEPGR|nr:hypothetical protein Nepgr_020316 [Nepenthes gracilis]